MNGVETTIDQKYQNEVEYGGTFDPFKLMMQILNKEVSNKDYSHLAMVREEAMVHLDCIKKWIKMFGESSDFTSGVMQERTDLANRYLHFLKEYLKGNDIR